MRVLIISYLITLFLLIAVIQARPRCKKCCKSKSKEPTSTTTQASELASHSALNTNELSSASNDSLAHNSASISSTSSFVAAGNTLNAANSSVANSTTAGTSSSGGGNSSVSVPTQGTTTATNKSSNSASSTGSSIDVSLDEFKAALTTNNYAVEANVQDQYDAFIAGIGSSGISSKTELAMFYAEIMWESGGLQYLQELACTPPQCTSSSTCCAGNYGPTYNGNVFYGRGYMQLSWQTNYEAASAYLFNGDTTVLRDHPDWVATNETLAWGTSFWYWKANVHDKPGVTEGKFGAATKAINGALECQGANTDKARRRFEIYQNIFKAWSLPGTPDETGCYN